MRRSKPSIDAKSTDKLLILASTSGVSTWEINRVSTGSVAIGEWAHVALTRDTSGEYAFFINGVASGTYTNADDLVLGLTEAKLGGHYALSAPWYLDGRIANFRMHSSVVTASEQYGGTGPAGTVFDSDLDDGSGTSVVDNSAQSNDGTLVGDDGTNFWVP